MLLIIACFQSEQVFIFCKQFFTCYAKKILKSVSDITWNGLSGKIFIIVSALIIVLQ